MKGSANQRPRAAAALVVAASVLSGGAALAYEVLWGRALVPALGNSSDASAAVLVAFMGAMGVGAVAAGRLGDRLRDPLLAYAAAELGLSVLALVVPAVAMRVLPGAAASLPDGSGPVAAWAFRLALAASVVGLPAALMGATLPLCARGLARRPGDAGRLIGWLYLAGTAGGCAGAAGAGMWVVPVLGISGGSRLAAGLNLIAAFMAATAARLDRQGPAVAASACATPGAPAGVRRWAAVLAFSSGALVLCLERLWSRLLVLILGHDTYGFAAMLVAAIAGLAIGGLVAGVIARRGSSPLAAAAALLAAAAACAVVLFQVTCEVVARSGPDPFGLLAAAEMGTRPSAGLLHPLAVSLLMALVPATLAGAVFPLACSAVDPRPEATGGEVGRIAAWNALGCVAGGLLPSLGIVGWLGIGGAFLATAGAASVPAVLASLRFPAGRPWRIAAVAAIALVAICPVTMPRGSVERVVQVMVGGPVQEILFHAEGRTGTVTVTEDRVDGVRQLFLNAVGEVSSRYVHDQSFSLLGHLGPLLHPDPRSALVVCYGGGLTAGAVATHPGIDVTVVDLEARVLDGARFFEDLNGSVASNPRVHVLVEDGRHHLLATDRTYDVITVDSTHPRAVDSWILYTREFYGLARERLSPGGIMVQWVPMHGMSEEEFRILVGTFLASFPGASLWANVGYDRIGFTGYALLVGGRDGPVEADPERIARRMQPPAVSAEMSRWGLDTAADVVDCWVAGSGALARWTADLPVNTDDRPVTPYVTVHSSGPRMGPQSLSSVAGPPSDAGRPAPGAKRPADLMEELAHYRNAEGFLLRGQEDRALEEAPWSEKLARYVVEVDAAREYQIEVAERYGDDGPTLLAAGAALAGLRDPDSAIRVLGRAASLLPGDPRPWLHLGLAHALAGDWVKAAEAHRRVLEMDPDNVLALVNLALALLESGDPLGAVEKLEDAVRIDPRFGRAWSNLGDALLAVSEPHRALECFDRSVRLSPGDPLALLGRGRALSTLKDLGAAEEAFRAAASEDPFWATAWYDLGLALLEGKSYDSAARALARSLYIDPGNAEAWTDLGLARAALGLWPEAAEAHLEATGLDPDLARAWLNLGIAMKALGRMDDAEAAFRVALRIDPGIAGR